MMEEWDLFDEDAAREEDPPGFNPETDEDGSVVYAGHTDRGVLTWLGNAIDTKAAKDAEVEDDTEEDKRKDSTFIASTGAVDRMGDVIDQKSWLLKNFLRNPVILSDHSGRDVVGKSRKTWRGREEDGKTIRDLRIRVNWDDDEVNPRGVLLAHQHRTGFRKAVSVGFYPHKVTNRTDLPATHPAYVDPQSVSYKWLAGYFYEQNELLEVSSVGIPANSEALQLAAEVYRAETRQRALTRYLHETTPAEVARMFATLIQRDANVRKSILTLVLGDAKAQGADKGTQNRRTKSDLDFLE